MRHFGLVAGAMVAAVVCACGPFAWAQSAIRPSPSPAAPGDLTKPLFDTSRPSYEVGDAAARAASTVVAEVEGHAITLAAVADRIRSMPGNIANLPYDVLFPSMVDQLIRREAVVIRARREGFDDDPVVRRRMKAAADEVLANEYLTREVGRGITETQLQERYRRDYAGKPGPDEVRVRVIMTLTEAEAVDVIARVKAGEDFAALAKAVSRDASASVGGDLGFLPRDGLNAEIGSVAFALAVGQVTAHPVRSGAGWFVVRVEDRRKQGTPPFAAVREQIVQSLVRERAPTVLRAALDAIVVHEYGLAGKEAGVPAP